jgi:hypothetical protein
MGKMQQLDFLEEAIADKLERLERWITVKTKRYERDVYVAMQEIYILKNIHKKSGKPSKIHKIEQLDMFA